MPSIAAMPASTRERLTTRVRDIMRPGVITIGEDAWLERDLSALPASEAVTEPAHFIEPGATARDALEALVKPGVTHLLVRPAADGAPQGVIAAMDLVDLVTHP